MFGLSTCRLQNKNKIGSKIFMNWKRHKNMTNKNKI